MANRDQTVQSRSFLGPREQVLPVELRMGDRDVEDSRENVEVTGAEEKKKMGKMTEFHLEQIVEAEIFHWNLDFYLKNFFDVGHF